MEILPTNYLSELEPEFSIIEPFDLNSEYFYYSSIFSKKEEEEEEDKIRYFVKEKSDTNDSSSVRITKEKTNNLIKVFNLQTPTIPKKRGRKPKDGNENVKTDEKKLSRKYDMDDIMIKNQIAYINFIMEFVNCILKHFNINDQFKKIDYSEKKKANFEYFKELKNKKLYELLIIKESKRYKNIGENHNYKLYLKIKELPTIKNILEENYLDFFREVYYKSERNISLSKYQDDENNKTELFLTLPHNIKTYEDKVKSFNEAKYAQIYDKFIQELFFNRRFYFN